MLPSSTETCETSITYLTDNPELPSSRNQKNRIQTQKTIQKKLKGRLWTNDFGRYCQASKTYNTHQVPLTAYHERVQTHRAVEIVFGSQSPLHSPAQIDSKILGPIIRDTPTTDRYIATALLSPCTTNSTNELKPVSSAEKTDVSPLSRPSAIEQNSLSLVSSDWLKIKPSAELSNNKTRGAKKNLTLSSKSSIGNPVIFSEKPEQYLAGALESTFLTEDSELNSSMSSIESNTNSQATEYDLYMQSDDSQSNPAPRKALKRKRSVNNKKIKGRTASIAVQQLCTAHASNELIQDSFIQSVRDSKWEWAHIIAKALAPSEAENPRNLVAMTNTLNTWMLFFETMANIIAANFPQVTVYVKSSVEVFQESKDIARALYYQIRCFYTDSRYIEIHRTFNIEKDNHKYIPPRFTDKHLLAEKFEELLEMAQDNKHSKHSQLAAQIDALVCNYQRLLLQPLESSRSSLSRDDSDLEPLTTHQSITSSSSSSYVVEAAIPGNDVTIATSQIQTPEAMRPVLFQFDDEIEHQEEETPRKRRKLLRFS